MHELAQWRAERLIRRSQMRTMALNMDLAFNRYTVLVSIFVRFHSNPVDFINRKFTFFVNLISLLCSVYVNYVTTDVGTFFYFNAFYSQVCHLD